MSSSSPPSPLPCFYVSPLANPHRIPKQTFLQVNNEWLGRKTLLDTMTSLIQMPASERKHVAIVIEGKPGSGRTSFAIFAAMHCSTPTTCVHYYNQSVITNKSFPTLSLESPAIPISILWDPKRSSSLSSVTHIVILDEVVDLKHFLDIKLLVQSLETKSRKKESSISKTLYIFIVDHPESRSMSGRMQQLFPYLHLPDPTPDQCYQIAQGKSDSFRSFQTLTTLFAAMETTKFIHHHFHHSLDPTEVYLSCRIVDHEKEVVLQLLRDSWQGKRIAWNDQQVTMQSMDTRNVALHLLENIPLWLHHSTTRTFQEKRKCFLRILHTFTETDKIDFEISKSIFPTSCVHTRTKREMIEFLRIGGVCNQLVVEGGEMPATKFPFEHSKDLEFTKLNTKYSMQQSEKWFMTLLGIRLHQPSLPSLLTVCMQRGPQRMQPPIDSESTDLWNQYLQDHPFLHSFRTQLPLNDVRHLFRFMFMRIGSMSTQSSRLQLSLEEWTRCTIDVFGTSSTLSFSSASTTTTTQKPGRKRKLPFGANV
jgi:hypothetical protein